jgi:hypothetical protein
VGARQPVPLAQIIQQVRVQQQKWLLCGVLEGWSDGRGLSGLGVRGWGCRLALAQITQQVRSVQGLCGC